MVNAEMAWVKLCLNKCQPIYVCFLDHQADHLSHYSMNLMTSWLAAIHKGSRSLTSNYFNR